MKIENYYYFYENNLWIKNINNWTSLFDKNLNCRLHKKKNNMYQS